MEFPRAYFAATISGENIYCFGGWDRGLLYSVESLNVISRERKRERSLPDKIDDLNTVTTYEA